MRTTYIMQAQGKEGLIYVSFTGLLNSFAALSTGWCLQTTKFNIA